MDCNKCDCPLRRTFKSSSLRTVTHVVIDKPDHGYGIFITTMLKEGEN